MEGDDGRVGEGSYNEEKTEKAEDKDNRLVERPADRTDGWNKRSRRGFYAVRVSRPIRREWKRRGAARREQLDKMCNLARAVSSGASRAEPSRHEV